MIKVIKMEEVSIEDFQKLDIRVARIVEVDDHPKADKLYVLKIEINGEERQLVAGIKSYYKKEELINKKIIVIANLKPAVLRGVESKGMLLAAENDGNMTLLIADKDIDTGAKIR